MKLATAQEMREIDRKAIEVFGIPSVVLMESAGAAVARAALEMLGGVAARRRVTVFCGRGNNGGDGLVASRYLANAGARVKVFLAADKRSLSQDASLYLGVLSRAGLEAEVVSESDSTSLSKARVTAGMSDLIVDALLGTGSRSEPQGLVAAAVDVINESGRPVLAVDVPSGLDCDTGRVPGRCVRATRTVTMGVCKIGLVLFPGAYYAGEVTVADIGIPTCVVESAGLKCTLLQEEQVACLLPARPSDSHKGTFGRVAVIAGSCGMTGAAFLTGLAALRAGAGLVTLGLPASLVGPGVPTELVVRPLPEAAGSLSMAAQQAVEGMLKRSDVAAIGPGLSMAGETVELVRSILLTSSIPCVLDADGINAVAEETRLVKGFPAPMVLTPHAAEMARLAGCRVDDVRADRLACARAVAAELGKVVVLKGARTLVALPTGEVYVNPTGNPGMATAGSGDVLTGTVAGLLGQGLSAGDAAVLAVYLHGLAGDMAAEELGEMGMIARDILDRLPAASRRLAAAAAGPSRNGPSVSGGTSPASTTAVPAVGGRSQRRGKPSREQGQEGRS